jgi:TetR/AcrR family transcriptional regulator, transcriptional repressor for nem operon
MGRDRQFDEDSALAAAADVFAMHGYAGTSLARLQAATGLGKQSLYNAWGDKRSLYLKAVDRAVARWSAVAQAMQAAADGRSALQRFFDTVLGQCSDATAPASRCIVSLGLLEGVDDALMQAELRGRWQGSHELLRAAVERGQRDGSIASRLPSAVLADSLMNLMSGLRVSARAGTAPARLRHVAELGLTVLDRR